MFDRPERCRQIVCVEGGGGIGQVFGFCGDRPTRDTRHIGKVARPTYCVRAADAIDARKHVCL